MSPLYTIRAKMVAFCVQSSHYYTASSGIRQQQRTVAVAQETVVVG